MVKILQDSLHPNGRNRFTTFQINFPKCLLAELNTHRTLVRNVGSSRAIPTTKMIDSVITNPFIPIFSRNQKGMVGADTLSVDEQVAAHAIWTEAVDAAIGAAEKLSNIGIHKEATNRLLEPFASVDLVLSGTQFNYFFMLRCQDNVQKSFQLIADEMYELYHEHTPNQLAYGEWHMPFGDYMPKDATELTKQKIAVARCARISYQTHDGIFSTEKDEELYEDLWKDKHLSPFEHVAQVVDNEQDIVIEDEHYDNWGEPKLNLYRIRGYLPDKLQDYLFVNTEQNEFSWTRQYAGFYTLRSQLEDSKLNL